MKNIKEGNFVGLVITIENSNTFEVKVLSPEKTLFQEDVKFNSVETDTEVVNTWENSYIYADDIVYVCDRFQEKSYKIGKEYTFHTGDIIATNENHIEKCEKRYKSEE